MAQLTLSGVRAAAHHIGRRGAYLLFLAYLDVVVSLSILAPLPLGLTREQVYEPFAQIMPMQAWSAWWAATAVLALVATVWHRVRPVMFAAGAAIKTGWALGYLLGWANGLALYTRGYQTATIYLGFAIITLIVAGWRENGT